MMPYWPFEQYEAERGKIRAARRRFRSRRREIAAAQPRPAGYPAGPARAVRRLFPARNRRPQCA
jgi:hypothetical protein